MLRKMLKQMCLGIVFLSGVAVAAETTVDLQKLSTSPDVRENLKGKTLRKGTNLIYTTDRGVKISARAEGGRVVDWIVTDTAGRRLPTTLYELSVIEAQARRVIRCWRCYKNPDGSYDCFQVPCPFRRPSGSGTQ
jgi:hypothetical protein